MPLTSNCSAAKHLVIRGSEPPQDLHVYELRVQVLAAFKKTRIVTWDAVIKLALPWSVYDVWVQRGKSKEADFLEAVGRIGLAHDKEKDPDSMWLVCDPLAVVAAISPELVTKEKAISLPWQSASCCVSDTVVWKYTVQKLCILIHSKLMMDSSQCTCPDTLIVCRLRGAMWSFRGL